MCLSPSQSMNAMQAPGSKPAKRRFRFSLRSVLVLITLVCIALAWWVVPAERQRVAVAAIRSAGGKARLYLRI